MRRSHALSADIAQPSVPHSRPFLGREEEAAALRVLRSGWIAPGPEATNTAERLARLSGCGSALLVTSGTTAIELALRALRIAPNDLVAIPSYACAALLHAVRAVPARPLLCDIDPETLALDPGDLDRRGRGKARAVVLFHPFGFPVRPEPFHERGLLVVEDCAQALGAQDRGAPVGSRGDIAVFSFGPTKIATCGGPGGGLASKDRTLVEGARSLAQHDETDDDRRRVNGLMGDVSAAVLGVQLGRVPEFRERRALIARRYDEALGAHGLSRAPIPTDAQPIVYRYIVASNHASRVIQELNDHGISARRPVYRPLHEIAPCEGVFPNTESAQDRLLSLPLHPGLSDAEVARVIEEAMRCRF